MVVKFAILVEDTQVFLVQEVNDQNKLETILFDSEYDADMYASERYACWSVIKLRQTKHVCAGGGSCPIFILDNGIS